MRIELGPSTQGKKKNTRFSGNLLFFFFQNAIFRIDGKRKGVQ